MTEMILYKLQKSPFNLSFYPLKTGFKPFSNNEFKTSKFKEFVDYIFELEENGGKLSKMIENAVEKVEIARYEQFLLFP